MSLSASAENLTNDNQNSDSSTMCLELALEGERLCKAGDCRAGVAFFQAAIQAGTDDLRTLSAIYSQLGNAYFYLGDYTQAMQYHKLDLTLARSMGDKLGEAKSSGNLGNTLKVMGHFEEAALCCERHLSIARELGDRASEGRALYNLGNVYHAQGKHLGHRSSDGKLDATDNVRSCLEHAVKYYQENLELMLELGDTAAQGRACGNLGNTLYLLGDFVGAIEHHTQRLNIARQFGDKQAERRAHSNLGNSHIFLGEFEEAAQHYEQTLSLAQELGERAVEAQACYSLGNTHTLLRDYPAAVDFHQRHRAIAQQLGDRVGEARAAWSLGNAYTALMSHERALYYATQHLEISKELGDPVGESTATLNIEDLRRVLGMTEAQTTEELLNAKEGLLDEEIISSPVNPSERPIAPLLGQSSEDTLGPGGVRIQRITRVRRQSMEQLDLIKITPDGKTYQTNRVIKPDFKPINFAELQKEWNMETKKSKAKLAKQKKQKQLDKEKEEESFFDLLTRYQSERMDDQRCTLQVGENKENILKRLRGSKNSRPAPNTCPVSRAPDELFDMIEGLQRNRMDEQRVSLPHLPGLQPSRWGNNDNNRNKPDDAFIDMVMRSQSSRIEEQRSALPSVSTWDPEVDHQHQSTVGGQQTHGATVPDEDFFALILRVQGGRMDDQRATVNQNPSKDKL